MATKLETDNLRDSPGTQGAMVGPRAAGGLACASSLKLLDSLRKTLRSHYYHRRSGIRTTGIGMVSPEVVLRDKVRWRLIQTETAIPSSYAGRSNYCWGNREG
jgi:hypothetical protein